MEQPLPKAPSPLETLIRPKTTERIKEQVLKWTEKGRAWLARLRAKADEKPMEVIAEVAEAPKQESELITDFDISEFQQREVDFTQHLRAEKGGVFLFSDILERYFPDVANLTPEQSHRVHAQFLLEATDRARGLIHEGRLDGLSSRDAFEVIAKIHQGRNSLEHVVAYYDPTISVSQTEQNKPNLSTEAMDMGIVHKNDNHGFEFGNLRKKKLHMARGGGESLIGVPASILPSLADSLFPTVDRVVANMRERWQQLQQEIDVPTNTETLAEIRKRSQLKRDQVYLEQEVVIFATGAATLADMIHFKADCNGRISEDWAVEIQRRIFGGTERVRTWVKDNMRAKAEEKLTVEAEREAIHQGNVLLEERTALLQPFRRQVMETVRANLRTEDIFGDEKSLLDKVLNESKTAQEKMEINDRLDDLLINHPQAVEKPIRDLIRSLETSSEMPGGAEVSLRSIGRELYIRDTKGYNYRSYDSQTVFCEPSPVETFAELHSKAVAQLHGLPPKLNLPHLVEKI